VFVEVSNRREIEWTCWRQETSLSDGQLGHSTGSTLPFSFFFSAVFANHFTPFAAETALTGVPGVPGKVRVHDAVVKHLTRGPFINTVPTAS